MERFKSDVHYARSRGFNYLVAFCHCGAKWGFRSDRNQIKALHDLFNSRFDLVVGIHCYVC